MLTDHFLQKHQVGRGTAYRFTQLRQDESSVECGKSLVGIDRQHPQSVNGRRSVQRRRLDGLPRRFAGHVHSFYESGLLKHATDPRACSSSRLHYCRGATAANVGAKRSDEDDFVRQSHAVQQHSRQQRGEANCRIAIELAGVGMDGVALAGDGPRVET